jgi:hypothetical protein
VDRNHIPNECAHAEVAVEPGGGCLCWVVPDRVTSRMAGYGWKRTSMGDIKGMEKDAGEQYYPLEAPVTDAGVCWRLPSPIIDFR